MLTLERVNLATDMESSQSSIYVMESAADAPVADPPLDPAADPVVDSMTTVNSSSMTDTWNSSNALDGMQDTCIKTTSEENPYWMVNLAKAYTIHSIKIYTNGKYFSYYILKGIIMVYRFTLFCKPIQNDMLLIVLEFF